MFISCDSVFHEHTPGSNTAAGNLLGGNPKTEIGGPYGANDR